MYLYVVSLGGWREEIREFETFLKKRWYPPMLENMPLHVCIQERKLQCIPDTEEGEMDVPVCVVFLVGDNYSIHYFYNKSKSSSLSLYLFTARRTLEVSTHVT